MRARHCAVVCALASAVALSAAPSASAQFFPSDCMESGGGRLLTAGGNVATFGGSASKSGAAQVAHQVYIDHVAGFRFRTLTTTTMICDLDARRAEMIGTGQVTTDAGVTEIVQYRIAVFDVGNPRLNDFYRITLSNLYDSGEQPVEHGNINVMAR